MPDTTSSSTKRYGTISNVRNVNDIWRYIMMLVDWEDREDREEDQEEDRDREEDVLTTSWFNPMTERVEVVPINNNNNIGSDTEEEEEFRWVYDERTGRYIRDYE